MNSAAHRTLGLAAFVLLALALLLSRAAVAIQTFGYYKMSVCRTTHWNSPREMADFWPEYLIPFIKPYSRIATENLTTYAQDLQAGRHEIFGSNGRAISVDHRLAQYLSANGMIVVEAPNCYHFKSPWKAEKLSELGVEYVIEVDGKNPDLIKQGWKLLAEVGPIFLYQNPITTGIAYFTDARRVPVPPKNISFAGNGMDVKFTPSLRRRELVVTLSARPGWKAKLNGRDTQIRSGDNRMMRFDVRPGDEVLSLRYEPFGARQFIAAGLISLLILAGCWKAAELRAS